MPNTFSGRGNLSTNPVLKLVMVNGKQVPVCEMEVFFDEFKRDARGEMQRNGGFFMKVSQWDKKGEDAARLLHKGVRVAVHGKLKSSSFLHKESGLDIKTFEITAEDIFLALGRIDNVQYAEKRVVDKSGQPEELEHEGADSFPDPITA